jgi:hypothetical protein
LYGAVVAATSATANDLGEIAVCDVIEDFISLTVDGVTETYFINVSISADSSFTYAQTGVQGSHFVGFGFNDSTVGNYDAPDNFIEVIFDENNNWDFGQGVGFETFNVTEYGGSGEKIVGEMSGKFENFGVTPNVTVTVTGSFSITNPN